MSNLYSAERPEPPRVRAVIIEGPAIVVRRSDQVNEEPSETKDDGALSGNTKVTLIVDAEVPERPLVAREAKTEPILQVLPQQYTLVPREVDDRDWEWYKKQQASTWVAEEVDLAHDYADFCSLSCEERHFIGHVIAFFASSDTIVADNLTGQFINEIQPRALKFFLTLQAHMENVHTEVYSNILTALVRDPAEQARLFEAVSSFPGIKRKVDWAVRWTDPAVSSYPERLIAFAVVEGVFFSGSFCAIFWLKKRGVLPGVCFANELISRDEGLHRDFAVYLATERLRDPASPVAVRRIVAEAVEIETDFVAEALPVSVIGISKESMTEYVKFVADHLLVSLGQHKLYDAGNPFEWMETISLQGKTNFFEKRVGEYARSRVGLDSGRNHEFSLDSDF
jgi:ribonucleotide reductase beta subunit family protein with ferritin-like domain